MSGFTARETAAGGRRIDGWHIISLLIAAPQNWIASRGLWSVRIWLMSPTPLLSPDSSPLSRPGLGFLSFPLTAIPPALHLHRCLYAGCILTLWQVKWQLKVCWPGLSVHLTLQYDSDKSPNILLKSAPTKQTSDVLLLLKTTTNLFSFAFCILTFPVFFVHGCLLFRDWSYKSNSSRKEWITASRVAGFKVSLSGFWGETELCCDTVLWFTHTSFAPLSKISHGKTLCFF